METHGPTLFLDGQPVGYWEAKAATIGPGDHAYMPFRGPGHYRLQTLLAAGQTPLCTCNFEGSEVAFEVSACPQYGILTVRNVVPVV